MVEMLVRDGRVIGEVRIAQVNEKLEESLSQKKKKRKKI